VHDEQGRPAQGIAVEVEAGAMGTQGQTKSGPDGTFRFDHWPAGVYRVVASELEPTRRSTTARVAIGPGERREIALSLPGGTSIEGVVIEEDGSPIFAAVVFAFQSDGDSRGDARDGTDLHGRFVLRHLLERATYCLVVSYPDEPGPRRDRRTCFEAGEKNARLVRAPRIRVTGRVLHEDGTPVTACYVARREMESADGRFEVLLQADDEIELLVSAPPTFPVMTKWLKGLHGLHSVDAGDIVLKPGRQVLVRIVDQVTGAPIPGAKVDARVLGYSVRDHTCGEDGEVTVKGLAHETTPFKAYADGYETVSRDVGVDQDRVTIALPKASPDHSPR
jgi:hypothetical protein